MPFFTPKQVEMLFADKYGWQQFASYYTIVSWCPLDDIDSADRAALVECHCCDGRNKTKVLFVSYYFRGNRAAYLMCDQCVTERLEHVASLTESAGERSHTVVVIGVTEDDARENVYDKHRGGITVISS